MHIAIFAIKFLDLIGNVYLGNNVYNVYLGFLFCMSELISMLFHFSLKRTD